MANGDYCEYYRDFKENIPIKDSCYALEINGTYKLKERKKERKEERKKERKKVMDIQAQRKKERNMEGELLCSGKT